MVFEELQYFVVNWFCQTNGYTMNITLIDIKTRFCPWPISTPLLSFGIIGKNQSKELEDDKKRFPLSICSFFHLEHFSSSFVNQLTQPFKYCFITAWISCGYGSTVQREILKIHVGIFGVKLEAFNRVLSMQHGQNHFPLELVAVNDSKGFVMLCQFHPRRHHFLQNHASPPCGTLINFPQHLKSRKLNFPQLVKPGQTSRPESGQKLAKRATTPLTSNKCKPTWIILSWNGFLPFFMPFSFLAYIKSNLYSISSIQTWFGCSIFWAVQIHCSMMESSAFCEIQSDLLLCRGSSRENQISLWLLVALQLKQVQFLSRLSMSNVPVSHWQQTTPLVKVPNSVMSSHLSHLQEKFHFSMQAFLLSQLVDNASVYLLIIFKLI